MVRWQLSTPILAIVMYFCSSAGNPLESINSAIWANIIGALIFFWIDLYTFSLGNLEEQWEVLDQGTCCDCGSFCRLYRKVIAPGYNRLKTLAEYRCEKCSISKSRKN